MNGDFDPARVARLRELLGEQFEAMAQSFRHRAESSLAEMREALASGRVGEMREVAHRLRSTFAQFGLMGAAEAARLLEYHRDSEAPEMLLRAVEEAYTGAQPSLAQACGKVAV